MERELQIQAVVTDSGKYGELHRYVNLFSPQLGLIKAVIFGGRKGKNTSLAPLFSFGTIQLYHNPVKDEYSVVEEDCSFIAEKIKTDISATYTASYFCELLNCINTDNPESLYILVTKALTLLENNPEKHRKILIDFTWRFLMISGVASDLSICPVCDRKLDDKETMGFALSMFTPVCEVCSDYDRIRLTPGARKYLSYTQSMSIEKAFEIELLEGATGRLTDFLLNWISVFSQCQLKTVKSGLL